MAIALDCEMPDRAITDARTQFRDEVLAGLSQQQKAVPAHWFYDHWGSQLFERITALPEYYPTRTERAILTERCADIARVVGPGRTVVEFGAGSAAKTPLVLDCIAPAAYVPIDISGEFLRESCETLAIRYPDLPIISIEADFNQPVALPDRVAHLPQLGFFPGSTIGNLDRTAAARLLEAMRATLGDDSLLLIGMDLIKPLDILIPAYDDAAGVTAAFNLNLAERINRELGGSIPIAALRHRAIWNAELARIEMHLEAVRDIAFTVAGQAFSLRAGRTIHTENSHKYNRDSADQLLRAGGWKPLAHYTDAADRFMVILAEAASR